MLKVTLLISSFNSTSQLTYSYLKALGYKVDVVYAICKQQMIDEIKEFNPNIILSPYLKKFIPKDIYNVYPTFVLHPGIRGDRGAYSLDHAIKNSKKEWGVVYLKADDKFDGGNIYAEVKFEMRESYKASIYRDEVNYSSMKALKILLKNLFDEKFIPLPQLDTPLHLQLTQEHRKIEWQKDSSSEIVKKIYMSDSIPGVLDEILGVECYLYGVWLEERLKGSKPKQILAKRDGAICISTIDGAILVTHLKEVGKFKLPATYVLKDRLKGVKEDRLPLIFDKSYKTFYEISCDVKDEVAYLYFNFHNGAFSSDKCMKLKYAFEYIKTQVKVVVLMGGDDFFSNGIHLNILEDSKKNGEDGWSNINAMNDLVKSVLFADDVITVASLEKNGGAGGVFLALACDKVIAKDSVVLNPHYKTLGLSGSEYHTYSLEKRVGKQKADEILNNCLPLSSQEAKELGVVDEVFEYKNYSDNLESFCKNLLVNEDIYDDFLWDKEDYLEENRELIESKKVDEIRVMYSEFWDKKSEFHKLRYEFVYKLCPIKTPKRLKYARI